MNIKLVSSAVLLSSLVASSSAFAGPHDKEELILSATPKKIGNIKSLDTMDIPNYFKTDFSVRSDYMRNFDKISQEISQTKTLSQLIPIMTTYAGTTAKDYKYSELMGKYAINVKKEDLLNSQNYGSQKLKENKPTNLFNENMELDSSFTRFGELENVGPNEDIEIVCGGGLIFLIDIMNQNREGYKLEGGVKSKGTRISFKILAKLLIK